MKSILATAAMAAALAGGSATASPSVLPMAAPEATAPPAAGALFADLAALGFDLGKFRPDYAGRFPYR